MSKLPKWTRSVDLKVYSQDPEFRVAAGHTCTVVNQGAAYYSQLLLEMRQQDVTFTQDGRVTKTADQWKQDLGQRLLRLGCPQDDEVLEALKELYDLIIKAQYPAGEYLAKLTNPNSRAGQGPKAVVDAFAGCPLEHPDEADLVITENPHLLTPKGRRPLWLDVYKGNKQHQKSWQHLLLEAARNARKKMKKSGCVDYLDGKGILPICQPFFWGRIEGKAFEPVMFDLATQALKSWQDRNEHTNKNYAKVEAKIQAWDQEYGDSLNDIRSRVRQFEQRRQTELNRLFPTQKNKYRLINTTGWKSLRKWLIKNEKSTPDKRRQKVVDIHRRATRSDFEVLNWLITQPPEVWGKGEWDPISLIAKRNRLQTKLTRMHHNAQFTFPHVVDSPRPVRFDAPPNSNYPRYHISSQDGRLSATVPLLTPINDQMLKVKRFVVDLASSKQIEQGEVYTHAVGQSKRLRLKRGSQDGLSIRDENIGGASLALDRDRVAKIPPNQLKNGNVGPVYLRITTDVGTQDDKSRAENNLNLAYFLNMKRRNKEKKWNALTQDKGFDQLVIRILSVDLGARVAGAVARGTAIFTNPLSGTYRPGWSSILDLPGERNITNQERNRRQQVEQDNKHMNDAIRRFEDLRRLANANHEKTIDLLAKTKSGYPEGVGQYDGLDEESLKYIEDILRDPQISGGDKKAYLKGLLHRVKIKIGQSVRDWKSRNKRLDRRFDKQVRLGGKSLWRIGWLQDCRRIEIRWNKLLGSTDTSHGLQKKIQDLKEDRCKTTADLIVQAARGLVHRKGRWQPIEPKIKPVHVIAMEDLSLYLPNKQRSKFENKLLMKSCFRKIRQLVEQQAQEYGISVIDVPAAYTSQMDADTLTPGMRFDRVDHLKWVQQEGSRTYNNLVDLGLDPNQVQLGDWIPAPGGKSLVTICHGGVARKHADINAAHNIGRRPSTGYNEVFKCTAKEIGKDQGIYVSILLNAKGEPTRLSEALGGAIVVFLPLYGVQFEHRVYPSIQQAQKDLGIGLNKENWASKITFFRDCSGVLFGGHWVPQQIFLSRTKRKTIKKLQQVGLLNA